jgi:Sortase and related acyltransferases
MKPAIRPIRPEDEPLLAAFHRELSEVSVHMRYGNYSALSFRTAHERLSRVCFPDEEREIVLVAENEDGGIMGVARLVRDGSPNAAEFALLVADRYQGHGLGSEMLAELLDMARRRGIETVYGFILPDNSRMQTLARELGFSLAYDSAEGLIRASLSPGCASSSCSEAHRGRCEGSAPPVIDCPRPALKRA